MRARWAGAEGQAPSFSPPPSSAGGDSGYFRETIRQDIRQARERFCGQQLRQELARLQRRLDSVELLSPDIIMNLLLSYRDVQVCGAQRGRQGSGTPCQRSPSPSPGCAPRSPVALSKLPDVSEPQFPYLWPGTIMSLSPRAAGKLGHTVGSL